MESIGTLFAETRARSVQYKGKTLLRIDELPVSDGDTLQVVFERASTRWHQGVVLKLQGRGTITVNGITKGKGVRLWYDTAPREVPLIFRTKGPNVALVYNVWDTGSGTTEAWIGNHAMIVTEIPNGRRYQCNDGYDDEDFEDLIFRVERIPPEEAPPEPLAEP